MSEENTSKLIQTSNRANIKSKLKIAMASFHEYSENNKPSSPHQNSKLGCAEETLDKNRINLVNLSPPAEESREVKNKFTFSQNTQKVSAHILFC